MARNTVQYLHFRILGIPIDNMNDGISGLSWASQLWPNFLSFFAWIVVRNSGGFHSNVRSHLSYFAIFKTSKSDGRMFERFSPIHEYTIKSILWMYLYLLFLHPIFIGLLHNGDTPYYLLKPRSLDTAKLDEAFTCCGLDEWLLNTKSEYKG